MKVKVEVTQEDIDNGVANSHNSCPIALACDRAGLHVINVDALDITVVRRGTKSFMHLDPPDEASQFIENFDDNKPVNPFSFDLDIPNAS